jgi:copper homeostasis protein
MLQPKGARRCVLVEVCVESADDAAAAVAGGADRIELNAALALDGLTPSPGLLREARRAAGRTPMIAMARPRAGGFCYSRGEVRTLLHDVESLLAQGADGVAFGMLTDAGGVDARRCRQVMSLVGAATAVFHRAFDEVPDPQEALEQLIDLGFRRVMTSGGEKTALRGARRIRELIERAAGRIEVLPAGGIRPGNAARLVALSECDQIHTSLRERGRGGMSAPLLRELMVIVR